MAITISFSNKILKYYISWDSQRSDYKLTTPINLHTAFGKRGDEAALNEMSTGNQEYIDDNPKFPASFENKPSSRILIIVRMEED